nr:SSI family serine proteinase inhibitor [Modestobacter versicolor]
MLLAGCAAQDDTAFPGPPEPSSAGPAESFLQVEVDPGDGTPAVAHTLVCQPEPSGTYPDPAAVCDQLEATADPLAPLPADQVCTEQYGGPQTARVTGRWAGEDVSLELARTNGCTIDQWNRLAPLLPVDLG